MEECDVKAWNVFDKFDITIPFSSTSFLEVAGRLSLKVATKGSSTGKENSENLDIEVIFLKQKWRNAAKKSEIFLVNLTSLYLTQLHIFLK